MGDEKEERGISVCQNREVVTHANSVIGQFSG